MRVFISYGHDRHVALARLLKETVTAAGHKVWFDETNIRHGSAWEASIEEGIAASDVVIAMMTSHAVRRPDGVCLDELSFARFSGKRILPMMVEDCRPPLCISRLQWLDLKGYEDNPDRTMEKLALVRSTIEMDGGEFEGTEARLIDLLSPLDFDAEIEQKARGFIGRRWVLDALEAWLAAPEASNAFFLTGAPGTGKTSLCAHLCQRHPAVGAVHLCNYADVLKSDARRAVSSISYQLSTQLPDYRHQLANHRMTGYETWNAATAFDQLIVQPLRHVARPKSEVLVVVDALDETIREGRSELAELLAQSWPLVPSWLRLFVTSRPESTVINMLSRLTPFSLDTGNHRNLQDIRNYFDQELKSLGGDTISLRDRLVRNSGGVFLYASVVVDELKKGRMTPEDLGALPGGLKSIYRLYFDRRFPSGAPERWRQFDEYIRPLLEILSAAYEPLPLETLSEILGWDNYGRKQALDPLGSLITTRDGRLSFFHLSFRDWLTDETTDLRYFVDPIRGHERVADFGWTLYSRGQTMRGEFTYLPEHLRAAGRPRSFSNWWEKVRAIEAGGGLHDFTCGRCGGGEMIEPRHGEEPSELCPTCFPERRAKGLR